MKKILSLLVILAGLADASAQGTIHFTVNLSGLNEVPPNNSPGTGTGHVTLNDNTLNVFVDIPGFSFEPIGAFIHGPANEVSTAPVIFDLGSPNVRPPIIPLDPGGYEFVSNGIPLSSSQITDLMNGLWYINITSSAFPDGELRGQIQLVPEPSVVALLSVGGLTVLLVLRRNNR